MALICTDRITKSTKVWRREDSGVRFLVRELGPGKLQLLAAAVGDALYVSAVFRSAVAVTIFVTEAKAKTVVEETPVQLRSRLSSKEIAAWKGMEIV